jgi:GNAT superfamily N-acetyltransferase
MTRGNAAHAVRWTRRTSAALAALVLSLPVAAQWPLHEAARAPRLADGKVDVNAATPRAADGHPDLSGLWERFGPGGANPNFDALQSADGGPPAATFWSVGAGLRGGPPYTPLASMLRDERMADNQKNNPDALCLPMGLMQLHLHPQPRKIVQTPGLIVIMYEGNEGLRQIFTDGRPLPTPGDELQPWWYGYSTGRWDGDTLVVETTGFNDRTWLDDAGHPHSEQMKVTERFRRPSFGQLLVDITIDDAKTYAKPWSVTQAFQVIADGELIEYICNENNLAPPHLVGK